MRCAKRRLLSLNMSPYVLLLLSSIVNSVGSELAIRSHSVDVDEAVKEFDVTMEESTSSSSSSSSSSSLLVSTLSGTLLSLDASSGSIQWIVDDEPAVKSPHDKLKPRLPAFLPDPKDGSLYMLGGSQEPLKKLPFTIPELVASSPCRSSDGILYTGRKIDTWFALDRQTGTRKGSVSFAGCFSDDQCPNLGKNNLLIGRTEYTVTMLDSRQKGDKERQWNVSFFDYAAANNKAQLQDEDYDKAHLTDSSGGALVTVDKVSGRVLWEQTINSPIVAIFRMETDNNILLRVPFTSVSKETLATLLDHSDGDDSSTEDPNKIVGEIQLHPTLYVGEHDHGLFAMPSLVDERTITISTGVERGAPLLEGPDLDQNNFESIDQHPKQEVETKDPLALPEFNPDAKSVLLFGHYRTPEVHPVALSRPQFPSRLQLTSQPSSSVTTKTTKDDESLKIHHYLPWTRGPPPAKLSFESPLVATEPLSQNSRLQVLERGWNEMKEFNTSFLISFESILVIREAVLFGKDVLVEMENKELKVITILLLVAVAFLFKLLSVLPSQEKVASYARYSNDLSSSTKGSNNGDLGGHEVTAVATEMTDGTVKVGNIHFDPNDVLGKGCEGTFVYRGRFDSRDVAVKRVLAANFSIANREVDLLRESDEHPNVIRYFCMEQDKQFRYIALEYCIATLQDYVERRYLNTNLNGLSLLEQATLGLAHLHHLDIVHRDVKPQNVLLSVPKNGHVKAMISDFGLCKKLKVGRMSFSRRSGIAGTEGWIAPEMMLGHRSNTCAVDIFSLGCVYYYVLSNGKHAFGESFRRQANILTATSDLSGIKLRSASGNASATVLITAMIAHEQSLRPSAEAVLKHPLFWSKSHILSFLQDVSDRVDKEGNDSVLVQFIERGKNEIIKSGNWHDQLEPEIRDDLRRHRTYNGRSIRELLRALRNKKHHYGELTDDIKAIYGEVPNKFCSYWIDKFPRLVVRVWMAMHCLKNENEFKKYFDKHFDFLNVSDLDDSRRLTYHQTPQFRPSPLNEVSGLTSHEAIQRSFLFEPHFINSRNKVVRRQTSKKSVVSNWDDLDDDHISNLSEDNNDFNDGDLLVKPNFLTEEHVVLEDSGGVPHYGNIDPFPLYDDEDDNDDGQYNGNSGPHEEDIRYEDLDRDSNDKNDVHGMEENLMVPKSVDIIDRALESVIGEVNDDEANNKNTVSIATEGSEEPPVWILPRVETKKNAKKRRRNKKGNQQPV